MPKLTKDQLTLEIEPPLATCGHCGFTSALAGSWSVEDGRLVWRGAPNPQPRRGPDLVFCCESSPVVEFQHVTVQESAPSWEQRQLSDEDVAALRASAEAARDAEQRAWNEAQGR